jgi:predicted small lipoprotein YifL
MMKPTLLLLAGLLSVLSACTLKGPEVAVKPPEIVVDRPVNVHTHSSPQTHPQPRHCPPGHAKKGWC